LRDLGQVLTARTAASALKLFAQHEVDCVVLDQVLPDMDTLTFLGRLGEAVWPPGVLLLASLPQSGQVMAALGRGADGYLPKPVAAPELRAFVLRVLERHFRGRGLAFLSEALDDMAPALLAGKSAAIGGVRSLVANVSAADNSVLISGEIGTGKETVARAIHLAGERRGKPFALVRCSYRKGDECRLDLFGEESPSHPGGKRRIGKFEYAAGGTIFIEDVDWMPMVAQASLVSIIQDKCAVRDGGRKPFPIDARIIASTTRDLREAVAQGTFRQDLYWRLAVVSVALPPLRERMEDLPDLLAHFFAQHACRYGRGAPEIAPEALALLESYQWPGNLDELDQVVQHILRSSDGSTIDKENLPMELLMASQVRALAATGGEGAEGEEGALRHARQEFERLFILRVLDQYGGNQVKAAKVLGVHRNTLINKMNELNLRYAAGRPRKRWLEADSSKA